MRGTHKPTIPDKPNSPNQRYIIGVETGQVAML